MARWSREGKGYLKGGREVEVGKREGGKEGYAGSEGRNASHYEHPPDVFEVQQRITWRPRGPRRPIIREECVQVRDRETQREAKKREVAESKRVENEWSRQFKSECERDGVCVFRRRTGEAKSGYGKAITGLFVGYALGG